MAALLSVGASASWATIDLTGYKVLATYDFSTVADEVLAISNVSAGTSYAYGASSESAVYVCTAPELLEGKFAFHTVTSIWNGNGFWIDTRDGSASSNTMLTDAANNSSNNKAAAALLGLSAGQKVVFRVYDSNAKSDIQIKGGSCTYNETIETDGPTSNIISYGVSITSAGSLGFSTPKYNASGRIGFLSITVYGPEATVIEPTITLTGVNGVNRTYTITNPNGSGTIYYTDEVANEQPAKGDAAYKSSTEESVEVTVGESGKLYAYIDNSGTTSDVMARTVTATEIVLPTPTYSFSNVSSGYTKDIKVSAANNVLLSPTVTLSYVFTPTGGSAQSPVEVANGGTISATEAGTYVITSSASGYTSSQITIENIPYVITKTYDFSALTASDLDLTTPKWTGPTSTNYKTGSSTTWFTVDGYTVGDAYRSNSAIEGVNMSTNTVLLIGHGLYPNAQSKHGYSLAGLSSDQYIIWTYYNYSAKTTAKTGYNGTCTGNGNSQRYFIEKAEVLSPAREVKVSSVGYATFCPTLNFDFSSATDIEACKASVDAEGKITYTVVNTVKTGEGVLLRSKSGGAASEAIPVIADATLNEDNAFVGIPEKVKLAQSTETGYTNYILSMVNSVLGFYKVNDNGSWCNAGTAYLKVSDAVNPARGFFALWGDETTGISAISESKAVKGQAYNLNGQRVARPTKGLYIVNGKKVIIK